VVGCTTCSKGEVLRKREPVIRDDDDDDDICMRNSNPGIHFKGFLRHTHEMSRIMVMNGISGSDEKFVQTSRRWDSNS
jgi:hypothetical protein